MAIHTSNIRYGTLELFLVCFNY